MPKVKQEQCCQLTDFGAKSSYFEYSFGYQSFSLFNSMRRDLVTFLCML